MAQDFKYVYQGDMDIRAGGYPQEPHGCHPEQMEVETAVLTGTAFYEYYYCDSNLGDNNNRSQVTITLEQSWEVTPNSDQSYDVWIKTEIVSFNRKVIIGNPDAGLNLGRDIKVWIGNTLVADISGDPIGYDHDLLYRTGPIETTLHIEPETSKGAGGAAVHVQNHTPGYAWAEPYLDEMYCGILFYNPNKREFGHCVYYDANGGRDAPEQYCWKSPEECDYISLSTKEPWSPHWVFLGWNTNANASTPQYRPGETVRVCDALTLYAIYRYTYRPGMQMHGGVWKSHDRDGASGPEGRANIRRGGKWVEMRIDPINSGLDDPPCIHAGGTWRIMNLIGDEGRPHHIKWDCPHQWN